MAADAAKPKRGCAEHLPGGSETEPRRCPVRAGPGRKSGEQRGRGAQAVASALPHRAGEVDGGIALAADGGSGAARDVLAAKGAAPALRASARLAQAPDRSGRAAKSANLWNSLGYVRRWQVIGPFDNASQPGFDKTYPLEREVALQKTCAGKDDQALHWHGLPLVGWDGQCAVGASLDRPEKAIRTQKSLVRSHQALFPCFPVNSVSPLSKHLTA